MAAILAGGDDMKDEGGHLRPPATTACISSGTHVSLTAIWVCLDRPCATVSEQGSVNILD
jgi:hypothetical protein